MRWAAIGGGLVFMFWLPVEDQTADMAFGMSSAVCVWLASWYAHRHPPRRRPLWGMVALGAVAGLAVCPLVAGLLLLKTGLHAHAGLELPAAVLRDVLTRTPIFGLSGLLIGLGVGLWQHKKPPPGHPVRSKRYGQDTFI